MSKEKQIEEMAKILCGMKNGCDGCMWDKVYCNERNYAEEIYNAGYRKQEWISVDERLPEDDLSEEHNKKTIKVLVAIKGKNGITIRTQERFRDYTYSNVGDPITFWTWRFSHGKVTHWMPLPEPPMMKGGAE